MTQQQGTTAVVESSNGAPPPAVRQKSEMAQTQQVAIQAMIETMVMQDSSYQGKLNVQMVWHHLQAPDSSFGWQVDSSQMPLNTKLLCIAATLKLGFTPGMGHVLWMGNKPYITADALRQKANSDPNWKYEVAPKLRPMNQDEKEMYGIEPGDSAAIIEAVVHFKGQRMEIQGVGIVEKGCRRPGSTGKKDRAMKLHTFAERDMLRRSYPCGIDVYDPDLMQQQQESASGLQSAVPLLTETVKQNELLAARGVFDGQLLRLKQVGVASKDITDYLGQPPELLSASEDHEAITRAAEALAEYPLPTGSDPAPAATTPEEPRPKGKPGRPPKAKVAANPTPIAGPTPSPSSSAHASTASAQPRSSISPPTSLHRGDDGHIHRDNGDGTTTQLSPEAEAHVLQHGDPALRAPLTTEGGHEPIPGEQAVFDKKPDISQPPLAPNADALPPPHREGVRGKGLDATWSDKTAQEDAYRTGEAAAPYKLIQGLLKLPQAQQNVELELALHALYGRKLKPGDQVDIAASWRIAIDPKKGSLDGFTALENAREAL